MKRLPISADDRTFLKALEGDPGMVVLLMLKIYPTPINADNLTFEMKWDQRKSRARKVLDDLSSDGFTALIKGQGYVLTSPAVRRISEFLSPILMQQIDGHQVLEQGNTAQAQSPVLMAGTEIIPAEFVTEDESQLKMSTQNARALKKEEEDSLIKKDKDSSTSEYAQNVRVEDALELVPGVTTARILQETSRIEGFGEVFLSGLDVATIHPEHALAWIAHAFDQRSNLDKPPAALVYSKLRNPEQPKARAKYIHNWENYLPDEFLIAIGWLEMKCATCEQTFESMDALEEHHAMMLTCEYHCGQRFHTREELDAHHETHEPTIPTFYALPEADRGAKAWKLVKDALAEELPKATFETWVRDGEAVGFADGALTVVVRNAYVADWLRSRMTAKIEAMLLSYLHETVRVLFVVGALDVEEDHAE